MKTVQWTETAKKTLLETSRHLIELWNSDVNDEFLDKLDFRIAQLQQNPELGPIYENSQIRRLVIHKNVSLFYSNQPDYIKLLVIWNNLQDPDSLLEKLINSQ